MPKVLEITQPQYEAFAIAARKVFARRLTGWLRQDARTKSISADIDETWALEQLAAAQAVGVTDEEDVTEFAVLRLLAPKGFWSTAMARDILGSNRDGVLKVFQLDQAFKGYSRRG